MPSYAEENKDLLKKFAKALYKGFDYRADDSHAEEVAGWIADELKLEKDTLLGRETLPTGQLQNLLRITWKM